MHWTEIVQNCLLGIYVSVLFLVAIYGFHRYMLVYLYLRHRDNIYEAKGTFPTLPKITIQLPMYNENTVAERVIRHTCQIDYPLDRLEIQVLDDSTDESADIAKKACDDWAARGYPIQYLHRTDRTGYKAGALAEAMKVATGDFVAIFDADFIPPRDVLRNVVDYFVDPKIGLVQVRWDHLNRDASLLTNCQAIFLDGHFIIEHTARNRSGRFMSFNGTAGVWRRQTIEDAGGWQHDTLCEDLDLSYRAQMKGWQFVYLPQFCVPAELPPEMIGYKQQSHRWTKGYVQTAIKLLPRVLKSRHLSLGIKVEAFFHLTNMVVYPLMVLLTLIMYPVFFGSTYEVAAPLQSPGWGHFLFNIGLFILATCSASTFFIFGQRELFGREAGWKTLLYLPFLMGLGIGVGINNCKAVFEAIWGAMRGQTSEFIRTPKYGVTGQGRAKWRRERFLSLKRLWMPLLEIAFGVYMLVCILIALWYHFGYGTVPFLGIFAGGYFYVGFATLHAMWKMNREANAEAESLTAGVLATTAE